MHFKITLSLLLAMSTSVMAAEPSGHDLMQKALRKERVEGDLKAAIELYRQIATDHAADRPLAAQALLQLGRSYEHLGAADARSAYEKLLSEYSDQAREVAEAKERLKVLNAAAPAADGDGQTIIQRLPADKLGAWLADPGTRPSPDGRYLAFVNWSQGNLAIHDTRAGESRDLTSEGTWDPPDQFCYGLAWSPDGRQIAFLWIKGEEGELRTIHHEGGQPRTLVVREQGGSILPAAWSPDGRYVFGLAPIHQKSSTNLQIVRVEVATGAIKPLKSVPGGRDSIRLTCSPDGQHIAYDFPAGQLGAMRVDGSDQRTLLAPPASSRQPVWMPDGRHLLFMSDRSGTEALWALPLKEGNAAGAPVLVRDGMFHANLWGCTHDSTLYWLTTTPRANVFLAEADFAAGTMGPSSQASLRFDGRSRHPRWSADGSELTYVARQFPGSKDATHVFQDPTTGKEREVKTPVLGFWGPPQWSGDGGRLFGRAFLEGGKGWGLYALDDRGGSPTLITDEHNAGSPNVSPDGNHLIYLRDAPAGPDQGSDIVERDLRSGKERVIRHSDQRNDQAKFSSMTTLNPRLSRDGSRLAYLHAAGEKVLLLVIARADGTARTAWELDEGRVALLDWLPDSRRVLVAVEDHEKVQHLHLVDVDSGSSRPFGQPFRDDDRVLQLSVHPNGKRVAFSRDGQRREIWTMKNVLPDKPPASAE